MRTFGLFLCLALASSAARARADDDGLYGRLDTDLRLSVAVGAGARFASSTAPIGLVELRARYLDSAGLFLAGDTDDARWRIAGGVELRPLFLARFLLNKESGRTFLDLLVDSLGFELGLAATKLSTSPVAAFVFGVGIDVPLVTAPFRLALRFAFRWTYAARETVPDATDVTLLSALVFDVGVDTGLATLQGPRARREP